MDNPNASDRSSSKEEHIENSSESFNDSNPTEIHSQALQVVESMKKKSVKLFSLYSSLSLKKRNKLLTPTSSVKNN